MNNHIGFACRIFTKIVQNRLGGALGSLKTTRGRFSKVKFLGCAFFSRALFVKVNWDLKLP